MSLTTGALGRAAIWTAMQAWNTQAVKLITLIVLARLLAPHTFGVFALAAAFLGALGLFVGQGMSAALVQRQNLENEQIAAAFWSITLGSVILGIIVAAAAGPIAALLGDADVAPVLRFLAPGFLLNGQAAIGLALLRRRLEFRRVAFSTAAGDLAGGCVAIALALDGFGIWSLVARQLLTQLVTLVMAWTWARQRMGRPTWRQYRQISRTGRIIAAGNIVVFARDRLDELVIGYVLGVEALGGYALARRQVEALTGLVPGVISNVGWPIFSALQADKSGLRSVLLKSLNVFGLLAWPAFAVFAGTATLWVPLLLGVKWELTAKLIPAIAIVAAIRALLGLELTCTIAIGHAMKRLRLEILLMTAAFGAMVVALPLGVIGVVWAAAAGTLLIAPFALISIARDLPVSFKEQVRLLARYLGIAAAIMIVSLEIIAMLRGMMPELALLVLVLSASFVAYIGTTALLAPSAIGFVKRTIQTQMRSRIL